MVFGDNLNMVVRQFQVQKYQGHRIHHVGKTDAIWVVVAVSQRLQVDLDLHPIL